MVIYSIIGGQKFSYTFAISILTHNYKVFNFFEICLLVIKQKCYIISDSENNNFYYSVNIYFFD